MEKISKKESIKGLPVINFHTAGIDVGSTLMVTGYTNIAGEQYVCRSGCFTKDLKELVGLLVRG